VNGIVVFNFKVLIFIFNFNRDRLGLDNIADEAWFGFQIYRYDSAWRSPRLFFFTSFLFVVNTYIFLSIKHSAFILNLLMHFLLNSKSLFLNALVLLSLSSVQDRIFIASFDQIALSRRYNIVQRGCFEQSLAIVLHGLLMGLSSFISQHLDTSFHIHVEAFFFHLVHFQVDCTIWDR